MSNPTLGFNVEEVQFENLRFNIWDVGGQKKIRYVQPFSLRFLIRLLTLRALWVFLFLCISFFLVLNSHDLTRNTTMRGAMQLYLLLIAKIGGELPATLKLDAMRALVANF